MGLCAEYMYARRGGARFRLRPHLSRPGPWTWSAPSDEREEGLPTGLPTDPDKVLMAASYLRQPHAKPEFW